MIDIQSLATSCQCHPARELVASSGMAEASSKQRIELEKMALNRMISLLTMLLLFLLFVALLGGVGIGIGFLLHWLIPAIGVEIGSLIGVVTLCWAIDLFARFISAMLATTPDDFDAADSEIETILIKPISRRRPAKRKK